MCIWMGRTSHACPQGSIARKGVARAFQIPQLFSDQRVIDNMMLALSGKERALVDGPTTGPGRTTARKAESLLDLFGCARTKSHQQHLAGRASQAGRHCGRAGTEAAAAAAGRAYQRSERAGTLPADGSADERAEAAETSPPFSWSTTWMSSRVMPDRVLVWNTGKIMAEGHPDQVSE